MGEKNITFDGRIMGFLRRARGHSQEEIIVEFLQAAVEISPAADAGSVLINHPKMEKLVLFNEDDFLFSKGLLDPQSRATWPKQFTYFTGIAGRCFREQEVQTYPRRPPLGANDDFVGNSPIKNMVCIPIMTAKKDAPFGVACFHNNDPEKVFSEEDIRALEAYTDILSLALHTPHPELQLERNVFIVHGRDMRSLDDLQRILRSYKVSPKVLADEDKNAKSILLALEELIRTCRAGFILATPDDEGHLKGEAPAVRARENVMFEAGLLFAKFRSFDRVSILLKQPLKLPSDLAGISYEPFDDINSLKPAIERKLSEWRLLV
jgi:predicted nucleotide-binding protein